MCALAFDLFFSAIFIKRLDKQYYVMYSIVYKVVLKREAAWIHN